MIKNKNNGFQNMPLGKLAPTEEQVANYDFPRKEAKSTLSKSKKTLLEDYLSGYITRVELKQLTQELDNE